MPLLVTLAGCHRSAPSLGSGDEWLSWPRSQRETFVIAFIDGHSAGQQRVCDNLEEKGWLLRPVPPDPNILIPCDQLKSGYTHLDPKFFGHSEAVDPYVTTIDDFYRHPECRVMPYEILLENLNDGQFKSGEDLYHYVQTDAAWGAFSGLNGIEKCYGVHSKWRSQRLQH